MEYCSAVSELNYMSQVVIMLYEDPTKDPLSENRCGQGDGRGWRVGRGDSRGCRVGRSGDSPSDGGTDWVA